MTSNQNPYAMQDAAHERMLAETNAAEAFAEEFPEWEQSADPERFVSEADYNAATPAEWEGLQAALDWEALDR